MIDKTLMLFAGTTEGRSLCEYLAQSGCITHVYVATEYGRELLTEKDSLIVHTGRLDEQQMYDELKRIKPDIVLDATHPYAVIVTQNIYQACKVVGVPYVRVRREMQEEPGNADSVMQMSGTHIADADGKRYTDETSDSVYVKDTQAAVDYLKGETGNILITTGSKELHLYTQIPDYESRCTARVLPAQSVVETCTELGFTGKHLICMQGPFDLEMNLATLRYANADFLVTKASGKNGGYDEKCEAALAAGVHLVVIGRPKEQVEPVMSLAQAEKYLSDMIRGRKENQKNGE